jgi:hypothetical protein
MTAPERWETTVEDDGGHDLALSGLASTAGKRASRARAARGLTRVTITPPIGLPRSSGALPGRFIDAYRRLCSRRPAVLMRFSPEIERPAAMVR